MPSKEYCHLVESYQVYYWSPTKAKRMKNKIQVALENNNQPIGSIRFYPDNTTSLPRDSVYVSSRSFRINMYYYESQYEQILDLMRNEGPIWVSVLAPVVGVGTSTYGDGEIRTGEEPVGEEET